MGPREWPENRRAARVSWKGDVKRTVCWRPGRLGLHTGGPLSLAKTCQNRDVGCRCAECRTTSLFEGRRGNSRMHTDRDQQHSCQQASESLAKTREHRVSLRGNGRYIASKNRTCRLTTQKQQFPVKACVPRLDRQFIPDFRRKRKFCERPPCGHLAVSPGRAASVLFVSSHWTGKGEHASRRSP